MPVLGVGYAGALLWGLGIAIAFPLAMSAAGETPGRGPAAIAMVATIAYSGFLVGPPLIGTIAHATGLDTALWVVVGAHRRHVRPVRHGAARGGPCEADGVPEPLAAALTSLRPLLLDPDHLVRAVAAGRRRGAQPSWQRATLRPVDLKDGRRLQVVTDDGQGPRTRNEAYGDAGRAAAAVDALLAEPFGNWHVQTTTETRAAAGDQEGRGAGAPGGRRQRPAHRPRPREARTSSIRATRCSRCSAPAPASGGRSTRSCTCSPVSVDDAELPGDRPLRVVDLGCGNAYLTFAAYRYLSRARPRRGRRHRRATAGARAQQRARRRSSAGRTTCASRRALIVDAPVEPADVVLVAACLRHRHRRRPGPGGALAGAGDPRLAVLPPRPAAPAQGGTAPAPYALLTRHAILRERFGDALTDALRAALLRRVGYRVEVVQFVASEYTPRNTMIKAVRAAALHDGTSADVDEDYDELVRGWGVTPYLQTLLADALG